MSDQKRLAETWLLALNDPRRLESNAKALREQKLREAVAGEKCRPKQEKRND
jgi:hypothetical protein